MFGRTKRIGLKGLKADINPAPRATLARKIARFQRVLEAQKRAIKRGDTYRAVKLEEEADKLSEHLLEHRKAIEEMLLIRGE